MLYSLGGIRGETTILGKKLDRALVNAAWLRHYPQSSSRFEAGGISDHARCVVLTSGSHNEARKPFRFFNYLAEHAEFLPAIKRVWDSTQVIHHSRSALSRFHDKLKLLKFDMRMIYKTHYGDLPGRTKRAFEDMCHCQNQALIDLNPIAFSSAAEATDRWTKLAYIEEKFFRQKSFIRWLVAGDQNTVFFHRAVLTRSSRNTIKRLVTEAGLTLTKLSDIKQEAVRLSEISSSSRPG